MAKTVTLPRHGHIRRSVKRLINDTYHLGREFGPVAKVTSRLLHFQMHHFRHWFCSRDEKKKKKKKKNETKPKLIWIDITKQKLFFYLGDNNVRNVLVHKKISHLLMSRI